MTFSLVYAWSENYVLPISHDEVVHGKGSLLRKMPGDRWQQLANLRAYLAFMWAHPGKQLLFMGAEFGQESEWAEARELDWWLLDHPEHRGVQSLVRDLNRVYAETPALWSRDNEPAGFQWIDANDASRNVFSFVRRGSSGAATWSAWRTSPRSPTRTTGSGCPPPGSGRRSLNTDAEAYAGSGVGNLGAVEAVDGRLVRPAGVRRHRRAASRDRLVPAPRLTRRCGTPRSRSGPSGNADVRHRVPQRGATLGRSRTVAFHNGARECCGTAPPCSRSRAGRLAGVAACGGAGRPGAGRA